MKRPLFLLLLVVAFLLVTVHPATYPQSPLRIVVLGSSTAQGCCAFGGYGWVDLYRSYLKSIGYPDSSVINLAVGGYTTFRVLPTGYVSPYRAIKPLWDIAPSVTNNITKALSLNATHIIINLPTNDANDLILPVAYQLDHYNTIIAAAAAKGAQVYVCTSQPRNANATIRKMLRDMRDETFSRYGANAVDFWTTVATDSGMISAPYDYGDGVHLNNAGHAILYERMKAKIPITPALTALPTSLSFGDVALGSSRQLSMTVTSQASTSQTLSSISTGNAAFSVSPASTTVPPGGSFTVTVTYTPKALGAVNDIVSFRYPSGSVVLNFPVSGNSPVPVATIAPASLDFGDVGNGTSRLMTVRITNPSINTMSLSNISTGTNAYVLDRTNATIAPSQFVDVAVTFSPLNIGTYADTLRIQGNAANFPVRIALSGRSPIPTLSVLPAVLDFGNVRRFTTKSLHIKLRNFSANTLDVTEFNTTNVDFSTSIASARVKPSDSVDMLVTFSPIAFAAVTDTLYLVSNSAFSPFKVPLRGNSPAPVLQVGTTSLTFPQYAAAETVKLPIVLYNRSMNKLDISSIQGGSPHFRIMSTLPTSLEENDSAAVLVGFVPRTGGVWRDTITIVSNGGIARVPMSGIAPLQKLAVKPNPISFGNVKVGESITIWCKILRMYPLEGGTVPVDSTVFRQRMFSVVAKSGPAELQPSDTLFVALSFRPLALGDVSDTLFIYPNGSSPIVGIPVSGLGATFTSVSPIDRQIPDGFTLGQNYPNPFNPSTTIEFGLPTTSAVTLRIFDVVGRQIALLVRETLAAGVHRIVWDAQQAAGGVYLYRLDAVGEPLSPGGTRTFSETRKLVLVK